MIEKLLALLDGKKTYLVAVLIGVGAVLQTLGIIVPDVVWPILGALGLGAVRDALNKLKA